ncbi:hypothetical protein TWF696_007270 [Orbilia brochopaga]|uniref:EVE domain-containing protein n=1 Tax=Orbilia brochopaga TaxID=3140254 RepID=A0AAV9UY61_9PEZI
MASRRNLKRTLDDEQPATTRASTAPTRRSQRAKLQRDNANSNNADASLTATDGITAAVAGHRGTKKPSKAKPRPAAAETALEEEDKVEPSTSSADIKKEENDAGGSRGFWLMKSEPDVFSYDDLCKHDGPAGWDGVRNHVAKNHLRSMKLGDRAFFYHSNCKEPGIVGLMEITRESSVDESQFDPKAEYYDAKATKEKPRWYLVHCRYVHMIITDLCFVHTFTLHSLHYRRSCSSHFHTL